MKREKEEKQCGGRRRKNEERGRRTRAAHPAEMPLGSNRILYVGKQEAAADVLVRESYELSHRECIMHSGSSCILAPS